MRRWYYVAPVADLPEIRKEYPVAGGVPRLSVDGSMALVRLSKEVDGALSDELVKLLMENDAWRRDDDV